MPSDYERIAADHRLGYGQFNHHLEGYEDFYPDDTHFVYELIQNAQDAIGSDPGKAGKRRFLSLVLREREFLAWNDGRAFTADQVVAICAIRQSQKDLAQIGTHGIGFKSVGKFTSTPEIYSGEERFTIHRRVEPRLIEDVPVEIRALVESGLTVFRLPFRESLRSQDIDILGNRLSRIHNWTLLFLHDLSCVEWRDERRGVTGSHSSSRQPAGNSLEMVFVELHNAVEDKELPAETFLTFVTHRPPPQSVIEDLLYHAKSEGERERIRASGKQAQPIEIAFAVRNDRITPVSGAVLFAFLPTRKETRLRFLLQAHYQTTFARDDIKDFETSPWNRWLLEETAAYFPAILRQLKEAGFLVPSFFEVLPVPTEDVPDSEGRVNLLQPILKASLEALREGEFIPTDQENKFAGPGQVFQPHTSDLRTLLYAGDLAEITGVAGAAWLHPGTRWDGRAGEIFKAVGVQEISSRQIVDWLSGQDADWFAAREDLWLRNLYLYLAFSVPETEHDRLKALTLAPREDGSHICSNTEWIFFQPETEQQRQDFAPILSRLPTLKPSAFEGAGEEKQRETLRHFLERIGVEPLERERMVVSWLIPEYKEQTAFSPEENHAHVRFIVDSLGYFSVQTQQALTKMVGDIPFLRARRGAPGSEIDLVRPTEIYLPGAFTGTNDLETYFGEDSKVWFLDEGYLEAEDDRSVWLSAMCKFGCRYVPRRITNPDTDPLSWQEKRSLRAGAGYTCDIKTVDWHWEGLSDALARITSGAVEAREVALALWQLLGQELPAESKERDRYLKGIYKWQFRIARSAHFDASFLRQLKEAAWIPSESGELCQPSALFLPDSETKSVLRESVPYLHPELVGKGDENASRFRNLGEALGINLNVTLSHALNYLQELSGSSPDIKVVERIYRFVQDRSVTASTKHLFSEQALIYTPLPQPRWWKASEAFWFEQGAVFGDERGYLEPVYPENLKVFFTLVDVAQSPSFPDYARALRELPGESIVTENLEKRLQALYQRLWAETEFGSRNLAAPEANCEQGSSHWWELLFESRCWMGRINDRPGLYHRRDLVRNDHDHNTELFANTLPFWSSTNLEELAAFLEIVPASQAKVEFEPYGERQSEPGWAERLGAITIPIACFLASPGLTPVIPDVTAQEALDELRVESVEAARVTYTLHGARVMDSNPLTSFIEVTPGRRVLWITRDVDPTEYPIAIGDALAAYLNVPQLGAFVEHLLVSDNPERVLARWKKKGLRYQPPALSETQEDNTRDDETQDDETQDDNLELAGLPAVNESPSVLTTVTPFDHNWEPEREGNDTKTSLLPAGPGSHIAEPDPGIDAVRFESGKGAEGHPHEIDVDARAGNFLERRSTGSGTWRQADSSSSLSGRGHGSGGGGEGEIHKALKRRLRENSHLLGPGLCLLKEEHEIGAGYARSRVDLLFKEEGGALIAVEVKPVISRGEYEVIWQAVRYQHLLAVEHNVACVAVRVFLAAPQIPGDIKQKCAVMGVVPIEVDLR